MKFSVTISEMNAAEFARFTKLLSTLHTLSDDRADDTVDDDALLSMAPVDEIIDKDGLPWDERIHSSSKAINADGRWKRRKNVEGSEYDAVVRELRGEQVTAPMDYPEHTAERFPVAPPAPMQYVNDKPVVVPPPPPPVELPTDFATFIKRLSDERAAGLISDERMKQVLGVHGFVTPFQVNEPEKLQAVVRDLWAA